MVIVYDEMRNLKSLDSIAIFEGGGVPIHRKLPIAVVMVKG